MVYFFHIEKRGITRASAIVRPVSSSISKFHSIDSADGGLRGRRSVSSIHTTAKSSDRQEETRRDQSSGSLLTKRHVESSATGTAANLSVTSNIFYASNDIGNCVRSIAMRA